MLKRTGWKDDLPELGRRNRGRLAIVAVEAAEALRQPLDGPHFLRGISCDPSCRRIDIELDPVRGSEPATVTIREPGEVGAQLGVDGRESSLWISSGDARVLLRLF
jgi:hypothetical protein